MWLARLVAALSIAALAPASVHAQPVRVWEEDVVIPTYPIGPDDVNPHFFELEGTVIYPYTMQDNLTTERVDRSYRAWFLENEYLKLMALPELGGRIQYVYDKRRDEPMFYHNRVIRPGLIALRGAWVSGGIEWNRGPTGHTVTSFSPVDVVGVDNPDGSASLLIGNTEMNFRTGWEVRLTLHPGRSYLDEEISLFNPTDGHHPYYFWNNTAFPNRPGTRFIYPMTLGTDHDGTGFFSWPEHEGRDLTWLRSYEEPTSIFAYRCVFDFFGAYDVDRDYGIVQVANHHVLPGKKAWTWGQADSGLMSQSVLTDEDGPYIEVQSGPLRTQADFAMLAPGQEVRWREYWYPVFGLGDGFELATRDLAVQRLETPQGVELRFHATRRIAEATIRVGDHESVRTLGPDRTERIVVDAGAADVSVVEDGRELLAYRSPLEVPIEVEPTPPPATAPHSADTWYRHGYELDLRMDRARARAAYERALAADPRHHDSLVALASMDLEAGRYDSASARLSRAVSRTPQSGMAHYLGAVASLRLGRLEDALAGGFEASKRHGTRQLGLGVAGRALMRMGRVREARDTFRRAHAQGGPDGLRLGELLMIATLADGDVDGATALARETVDRGTTRLVPHAVLSLAGESDPTAPLAWVGEDVFTVLEAALAFAELGRRGEAREVLASAGLAPHPLVLYYLAHWSDGKTREAYLDEAVSLSHDYVFPSRPETIPVLEAARESTRSSKVDLALGNLYAGLGRWDEATSAWLHAVRSDGSSVAHRNLAMVAWRRNGDRRSAVDHFEQAIAARPSDQTLFRDLAKLHLGEGRSEEAVALLEGMPTGGRRRPDVTLLLARALVASERYSDAVALLEGTRFTNREGDASTWRIFSRAHIERGRLALAAGSAEDALRDFEAALTYPVNLNVGRPARPREARALFFRGRALHALSRAAEARAVWRECAGNALSTPEQEEFVARCREALAEN